MKTATICFKGGVKVDFPKHEVKNPFFAIGTNYKLQTEINGEKAYVSFRGDDVLYVISEE